MKKIIGLLILLIFLIFVFTNYQNFYKKQEEDILTESSSKRSFNIEVRTIGELEAMHSKNITSSIKGDLGKIVYIVSDGMTVNINDTLVRMDPAPFEEQIEDLKRQIREQDSKIKISQRLLSWETIQTEHEICAAKIEIQAAQFEMKKIINGDGPIEEARLKSAMQKSFTKLEELKSYADDLIELHAEEFLNPIELKQAKAKLLEEEEIYQASKIQYETYIKHTLPMQIKKSEMAIEKCKNKYEEIVKSGNFRVSKAEAQLDFVIQEKEDLECQLANAEHQMTHTVIKATAPGMVVLREEYRNGQKRKPRVGDVMIKNQTILDLPDLGAMLVKTKVREIDLFKIKVGMPASVEMDANPELKFKGSILSIGVLAVTDIMKAGDEKYFDVVVKLDMTDPCLRPGMTARVVIHANSVENKLSIPVQAVFEFRKTFYCFVKKEDRYLAKSVDLGLSNEYWVEVQNGLEENEEVLLSMPDLSKVVNLDLN
jgi:HlyD family secretion protein